MYTFNIKFEYHQAKSLVNRQKHGISLEEAKELWRVPNIQIDAQVLNEPRVMIIGKVKGKFHSCVFTMRGEVIRLISARRSRSTEERIYHERIGQEKADG